MTETLESLQEKIRRKTRQRRAAKRELKRLAVEFPQRSWEGLRCTSIFLTFDYHETRLEELRQDFRSLCDRNVVEPIRQYLQAAQAKIRSVKPEEQLFYYNIARLGLNRYLSTDRWQQVQEVTRDGLTDLLLLLSTADQKYILRDLDRDLNDTLVKAYEERIDSDAFKVLESLANDHGPDVLKKLRRYLRDPYSDRARKLARELIDRQGGDPGHSRHPGDPYSSVSESEPE